MLASRANSLPIRPNPIVAALSRATPLQDNHVPASNYERLVRAAWLAALGRREVSRSIDWEKDGGDSLKIIDFLLRLEELIGRQIPIELLSLQMTMSSLARDLQKLETVNGGKDFIGKQPRCFFAQMIGVTEGTPLKTKSFIRNIEINASVQLLRYESIDILGAGALAFSAIVDTFLDQVLPVAQSGTPVILVGHSFGGVIMYEVGRRLEQAKVPAARIVLIDAQVDASHHQYDARGLARTIRASIQSRPASQRSIAPFRYASACLLQSLLAVNAHRTLCILGGLAALAGKGEKWRRHLAQSCLRLGRIRYAPGTYSGKVDLLFGSYRDVDPRDEPQALGWAKYAPDVRSIKVPCEGHGDILISTEVLDHIRGTIEEIKRDTKAEKIANQCAQRFLLKR